MIFTWFDARAAKQFGESLAEFLAQRIPCDAAAVPPKKGAKKRHEAIPKVLAQVDRFKQEQPLNFYQKAKLANAFKWKLVDMGYSAEFTNEMAKEILLHL